MNNSLITMVQETLARVRNTDWENFIEDILNGKRARVQEYLHKHPNQINEMRWQSDRVRQPNDGIFKIITPLSAALRTNDVHMVELLLNNGADLVQNLSTAGLTSGAAAWTGKTPLDELFRRMRDTMPTQPTNPADVFADLDQPLRDTVFLCLRHLFVHHPTTDVLRQYSDVCHEWWQHQDPLYAQLTEFYQAHCAQQQQTQLAQHLDSTVAILRTRKKM